MATGGIFKPTYSRKETDEKTGEVKTVKKYASKWYAWISYSDGRKERKPLATDKSVAQRMLAELLREADLAEAGLADPYVEHRKRPLSDHLDAWEKYLRGKARSTPRAQRGVTQTVGRARLVFDGCGFIKLGDINGSKVLDYIAGLQKDAPPTGARKKRQQLSLQTLNYYLRCVKQFCRWAVRDRRWPDNPLVHLQSWNTRLDRRHDRRALTLEEIGFLLATTRASSWVYRGLTGADRAVLYSTALGTGLRVSELSSLLVGSFRLDATPPVVHLLAAYAKNETQVDQPLPAELVELLRPYLKGKPTGQHVWPGTWSERSARMFRTDLQAARTAWLNQVEGEARRQRQESSFLAYRDSANLVADMHALRHTYITFLVRSGVSPKLAQSLARHSDINLTMSRYTHVGLHDQAAALDALPRLIPSDRQERGDAEQRAG